MSSWFKPSLPPASAFVPRNRFPLKGITIGVPGGAPSPEHLRALNALGMPLLCRMPVQTADDARIHLEALVPYENLSALLMLQDITPDPSWSIDHFKLWGLQFGNETDLKPYEWTPEKFAERVTRYYQAWRSAGFTKSIVSGGIFSVEAKDSGSWHAAVYLKPLLAIAPRDLIIDVHWYGDSSNQWKARLADLTAGFQLSVSEYGLPSRTPEEDHKQVEYISNKDRDFYALGALFTCVYQAASGSSSSDLDNYGLFRFDGTVKPALECLGQRP